LDFFFFVWTSGKITNLSSLGGNFKRRHTIWTIMADSENLGRNVIEGKGGNQGIFFLTQILLFGVDKKNGVAKFNKLHVVPVN
jgi:hypothetical protein